MRPIDIDTEAGRFFDDSSLPADGQPVVVFLLGGVGSGKSTIRQQQFASGYVLLDAATIFLNLTLPARIAFPDKELDEPLNAIGLAVAARAVREGRRIVVECIGLEVGPISAAIDSLKSKGYKVEAQFVDCDVEEAWKRNLNRGEDNISAYYLEPYHLSWLMEATRTRS